MPLSPTSWGTGGGGGGIDFGAVANTGDELAVIATGGDIALEATDGEIVLTAGGNEVRLTDSGNDFIANIDDDITLNAGNALALAALNGPLDIGASGAGGDLTVAAEQALSLNGATIGFFGTFPGVGRPSGVPVTAAGIHAALVSLGLITA